MPIAKEKGGNFTPAPQGTHLAKSFGVISLGTQHNQNFADAFKIMIMWELPNETVMIDGKPAPMVVNKEYSLSLSQKANLRRDLESWRGRAFTPQELDGFAVEKILGKDCMLTIAHQQTAKGSVYAKITSVSAPLKGAPSLPQFHKNVHFEIEHGENDVFKALPEWIRKKIQASEEWNPTVDKEEHAPEAGASSSDAMEEVPFSWHPIM